MQPSDSMAALNALIAERGLNANGLTASDAVSIMTGFYVEQRAGGIAGLDEDGDMLLFEWGVSDGATGPSFQFGLTRQFVATGLSDDDSISQLQLTLFYDDLAESDIGRGHRWCHSPHDIAAFTQFIESSPAASLVRDRRPNRVQLHYEQV